MAIKFKKLLGPDPFGVFKEKVRFQPDVTAEFRQPAFRQLMAGLEELGPDITALQRSIVGGAGRRPEITRAGLEGGLFGPFLGGQQPERLALQQALAEVMAPTAGSERFQRMAGRVREGVLGELPGLARTPGAARAVAQSLGDLAQQFEAERAQNALSLALGLGGITQQEMGRLGEAAQFQLGLEEMPFERQFRVFGALAPQQQALRQLLVSLAQPAFQPFQVGPSPAERFSRMMFGDQGLAPGIGGMFA